jgi:alanine racemase
MNLKGYTVLEIAEIIAEQSRLPSPNEIIRNILTDSRKLRDNAASVFFVLKGRKDAHQYIPALYQAGVRCFVYYDEHFAVDQYPDANFIYAPDPLQALQKLTSFHRSKFSYPIIGITGSNGKTVVKEWLYQLLAPGFHVIRSPKSYNSQVGVPLSVWQMDAQFDYGIFEAGISLPHEMSKLEEIIKPTIGVLTNIGSSHDEGFSSREQKISEKFQLFVNTELLVCNADFIKYKRESTKCFSWSLNRQADLEITAVEHLASNTFIKAIYLGEEVSIQIPFIDKASVENAITCWATLLAIGVSQEIIRSRMPRLMAVKMRLELKSGINQTSVIDDSYNSDFTSLEIALDFLDHQNQHPNKTLILSDIYQSGLKSNQLYKKLAQLLKSKKINRFIGIGEDLSAHQDLFKADSQFFRNTQEFIDQFKSSDFNKETILLKGARNFEFEKISAILNQKVHETILEINLNALEQNLNFYKSKLAPGIKLMAMVKAFAYGSGSYEIANLLQFNRVDYLAVAYADEGIALRENGIILPIMVMNPEISSFESIVQHNLEPEIFSFKALESLATYLRLNSVDEYYIHLKLDTGMHRLGFEAADLDAVVAFLKTHPAIKIRSVFSHLVASEADQHNDYTGQQIKVFKDFCVQLEEHISYSFIRHISNTSAIRKWPEAQFDMVRLGIGLYGIDNLYKDDKDLQQVATLKTTVSQIKHLKKGQTVGYGRAGVMPEDGQIATVKIGYADGYLRALGNGVGSMFINGKEAFTIGNICMDMCMLNVTGINIQEGDEVIVFNTQQSLYKLAEQLNTIPYEVLTSISQRVKRVYYYE